MNHWPSLLTHYAERGSYKLVPRDAQNLRTSFDHGPARVRRRSTAAPAQIEFKASMRESDFEVFRAFYEGVLYDGSAWFIMPIYTGGFGGYQAHEVRFVEHYTASDDGFSRVAVQIKLEARRINVLDGFAAWLVGEWGYEGLVGFADPLQIIVNTDYPAVMENY